MQMNALQMMLFGAQIAWLVHGRKVNFNLRDFWIDTLMVERGIMCRQIRVGLSTLFDAQGPVPVPWYVLVVSRIWAEFCFLICKYAKQMNVTWITWNLVHCLAMRKLCGSVSKRIRFCTMSYRKPLFLECRCFVNHPVLACMSTRIYTNILKFFSSAIEINISFL